MKTAEEYFEEHFLAVCKKHAPEDADFTDIEDLKTDGSYTIMMELMNGFASQKADEQEPVLKPYYFTYKWNSKVHDGFGGIYADIPDLSVESIREVETQIRDKSKDILGNPFTVVCVLNAFALDKNSTL